MKRQQSETAESTVDMSHLEAPALRRIIERHVRWRDAALKLFEQVNNGYEGEWPELADFIRNSTTRLVSAEKATACNHDLQDPAKTLKSTLAPHFGWRCTVCKAEWFPEKTNEHCDCPTLARRGEKGNPEIYCPKCGKVFRESDPRNAP